MSFRNLVTGNDGCTTSDGAGPSNAMAALANSLLGGTGKQQQQLAELPCRNSQASLNGAPGALSPDEFLAHMQRQSQGVPPVRPGPLQGSLPVLPGPPVAMEGFEEAWTQGPAGPPMGPLGPSEVVEIVSEGVRAMMACARRGAPFPPLNFPPGAVSIPAAVKIRDRATILLRQVFTVPEHATEWVNQLLHMLHVNPDSLPVDTSAWDGIYKGQPGWAARTTDAQIQESQALLAQINLNNAPAEQWAKQYANGRAQGPPQGYQAGPSNWGNEFAQQQERPVSTGWANQYEQQQGVQQEAAGVDRAMTADGAEAARLIAETLANSDDPKMKNSQFLQFMSKMSQGELVLEGNQVREVGPSSQQWSSEFAAQHPPLQMSEEWAESFLKQVKEQGELLPHQAQWLEEFLEGSEMQTDAAGASTSQAPEMDADWANEFSRQLINADEVARWSEEFVNEVAELETDYQRDLRYIQELRDAVTLEQQAESYKFQENNPFMADANSQNLAPELFRTGYLSEAVLALEAEVQRNPQNASAWQFLGTVQAENDDDRMAIAAMARALLIEPNNLEVLMAMGVAHTNELDKRHALRFMHQWLKHHPTHHSIVPAQEAEGANERLPYIIKLFGQAANASPQDADVHSALGVLHNLARRYTEAADSFRFALRIRPNDYSLWNKLGATLANGNKSSEAIQAYQRALELKSNYMRAWTNMGIAYGNMGDYNSSAWYYVRALALNPGAEAVWGYLRTALVCEKRMELLPLVDDENIKGLYEAMGPHPPHAA